MTENNVDNGIQEDVYDKEAFRCIDEAIRLIMEDSNYNTQSKQVIDTLVHAKELVTVKRRKEATTIVEEVRLTADRYLDKELASSINFWLHEALLNL